MDAVEFAVRVRRRKDERRLSQASLASLAGVSESQVAKLLGKHPPRPTRKTAIDLARALEWEPDAVLAWLGYEQLSMGEHAAMVTPEPSEGERLKVMLRVWCRLSRSDQDVLMEVAALLDSRAPARPGTGVTLLEAGPEVSSIDPRFAVQDHD